MDDYKNKLIEQIAEQLSNLEKSLMNGAYQLRDRSIKEIIRLVNHLYEVSPGDKLTMHLLRESSKLKKTKNTANFSRLFNMIKGGNNR